MAATTPWICWRKSIKYTNNPFADTAQFGTIAAQQDALEQMALEKKRLMVVDDQVSLTRIVGTVASDMGLEVRIVNDPNEALDSFLDFRPDILLLDMVMPEKDGVDVLNEIMLTGIATKIVLTSGFTENYTRLASEIAAFHDRDAPRVLKKPFRRDQLKDLLREIVVEN